MQPRLCFRFRARAFTGPLNKNYWMLTLCQALYCIWHPWAQLSLRKTLWSQHWYFSLKYEGRTYHRASALSQSLLAAEARPKPRTTWLECTISQSLLTGFKGRTVEESLETLSAILGPERTTAIPWNLVPGPSQHHTKIQGCSSRLCKMA